MDDRKRDLENFIRKLKYKDDGQTGKIISADESLYRQALDARNISEQALAHQVLKNTGVAIPGKLSSTDKVESFLNKLVAEQYPEFAHNPNVRFMDKVDPDRHGFYDGRFGSINLNPADKDDLLQTVATTLHETGHKYDHQVGKYKLPKELYGDAAHPSQLNVKHMYDTAMDAADEMDPTQLYEVAAKGHHARIPDLRDADSFGLGALKSYLKSGKFKSIAGALPLAGTAMALSSGDASAAAEELPSELPIVGQAYDAMRSEPAGNADDDREMKNEVEALKNYDSSPAKQDRNQMLRQQALQSLLKK